MMKTKSLKIAIVALIAFAGNALAQKDITSTYITNATLSNGTTGWAALNFNAPVQGNNTVGYASEAYAGWGSLEKTSYSLLQNITLPAGSYRLVNYSFFRQGLNYNTDVTKSLAYLKAGDSKVPIKTLGSITAAGYANTQAEGANCFDSKMYRNVVEFEIASDNTTIEIGITGTFDLKQSWCIAGMFELFDLIDLASVSSPTDVTYAITNPGFEYRDATGWTSVGGGGYANNNNFGHKAGIGFVERWQSSNNGGLSNGTFTQTLTGMQNGLYELAVYAQNLEQGNNNADGTGMFVTANDKSTEVTSSGQHKVRTTVTDGNLTIGIKLDGCTGNWIAFDRFGLLFYGDPDEAFHDLLAGYINEAEGLLASSDADLLTSGQRTALENAVNDARNATSNLEPVCDMLSGAIQTARHEIQTVKDHRVLMIAALERFENDYNLADGTDYSRSTMSAAAWTTLLDKVNAVSIALDDASLAAEYGTRCDVLVSQMDATDVSLRLFKSYKAMAEGCTALNIAGDYGANSNMDTDDAETTAINALNTAFVSYSQSQDDAIDMAAFLGSNLDFNSEHGDVIVTGTDGRSIYDIAGWEEAYANLDSWRVMENQHAGYEGQLYIRANWGSAASTLTVAKQKMLPEGIYRLSFSWRSSMANMTNLSQYKLGETTVALGESATEAKTLNYEFEVTGGAKPFDLTFGFQKKNSDNTPAEIIVDDVVLTTSIHGTTSCTMHHEADDEALYDLQGRRVNNSQPRKGLYIRNGRKVVVSAE